MSYSAGSAVIGSSIAKFGNSAEDKMEKMFQTDTKQGDKLKLAYDSQKEMDLAKKGEQSAQTSRLG